MKKENGGEKKKRKRGKNKEKKRGGYGSLGLRPIKLWYFRAKIPLRSEFLWVFGLKNNKIEKEREEEEGKWQTIDWQVTSYGRATREHHCVHCVAYLVRIVRDADVRIGNECHALVAHELHPAFYHALVEFHVGDSIPVTYNYSNWKITMQKKLKIKIQQKK